MRYYAEFHDYDLAGQLVAACGDRALINIDGRHNDETMRAIAADECKKRGYKAFAMLRGNNLREAQRVGPLESVEHLTDLQTIGRRLARGG